MDGDAVQSRFIHALRTQKGQADTQPTSALPCPYGCSGRIFADKYQVFDHVKVNHSSQLRNLSLPEARSKVNEELAQKLRSDQSSDATAGDRSTPDIAGLTIGPQEQSRQASPPSRKRPAETDIVGRKNKGPSHVEVVDADFSRTIPYTKTPGRAKARPQENLLFDHKQTTKGISSPHHTANPPSSATSVNSTKVRSSQSHSTLPKPQNPQRQPGLIELPKYDPRYPSLLLQPDSRPISQEQLASEVKSIYAGLTMVETKCIHVDRAQAAAPQDNSDPKRASDHWQALITLHRTLLHEHHDFFLASQHPSASPALRRLAAKYSMPARMWKHGIHSFLELLRRRLPESIDYMLAFIYLAYQMMALLYETVPAFEDTWIECLGDLGRYRMAIEDEDVRDRETWAGVSRSWYTKAADKNPTVGRLYHHLAILARPNALQQMYYYARSLTCVKPFPSARESIMTLLDPIMGRSAANHSQDLPVDTNFIKAHAVLFEDQDPQEFQQPQEIFINNLDNHVGRVTAKWKEQGVYIAVTNIAGLFEYGKDDNVLRQVFLNQLFEKASKSSTSVVEDNIRTASTADQQDPTQPSLRADKIPDALEELAKTRTFPNAKLITNETFSLVLRRIGDKNVLPHVHVMLSFLTSFASSTYVSDLLHDVPWSELAAFLNTLMKTEMQIRNQSQNQTQNVNTLLAADLFPGDGARSDEYPLPEDYLVRGLIWAQDYFPQKWFEREHDEEERYLEMASTVKNRMERVLKLGYTIAKYGRWMSYNKDTHTFAVIKPSH